MAEGGGDGFEVWVLGRYAAAGFAAIDLDQGANLARAGGSGMSGDSAGGVEVVGNHFDVDAGSVELGDLVKFLRRDADGIEDVGDAVGAEVFRFRKGGDGDAGDGSGLVGQHHAGDVDRLGGFHVRAQRHAEAADGLGHAVNVAGQHAAVQHQARGGKVRELHGSHSTSRSSGIAGRGRFCQGK